MLLKHSNQKLFLGTTSVRFVNLGPECTYVEYLSWREDTPSLRTGGLRRPIKNEITTVSFLYRKGKWQSHTTVKKGNFTVLSFNIVLKVF